MEDYLFGFDINNPEWLAQREAFWVDIERDLKKDHTRKEMNLIREIFFTGSCDLDNPRLDKDYYLNQPSFLFKIYPQQCERFWEYYVNKFFADRYPDMGRPGGYKSAVSLLDMFERTKSKYGWTVDQEVRAHKFFHGEKYIPGEVEFLGEKIINPLPARYVVSHWSREVREWLGCVSEDNKYIHLVDYFFDALICLDVNFYGLEDLSIKDGYPTQLNLRKLINAVFNYDREKLIKEYKKDKRNNIYDGNEAINKKRDEYVEMLKFRFSEISEPFELAELIKVCGSKKFKIK